MTADDNAPIDAGRVEDVRYSRLARAIHWITAALIFLLVPLGLVAHWLGKGDVRDTILDHWHKPLGLVVIVLTMIRLAVSTRSAARPGHHHGLARWEIAAARLGHIALYALLLSVPLSGVMMSQGAGKSIIVFGLFTLPQVLPIEPGLPPPEQTWFKLGRLLHTDVLEWSLYAMFAAHIAGVAEHQWIDGDRAFIRRMWSLR